MKDPTGSIKAQNNRLTGIYRGVVERNDSPTKDGRCQIRVFGIHTANKVKTLITGIPTEELPWAEPACGLTEGSISGFGLFGVPLQGSHVFVFFENGNPMKPIYFATAPGIPTIKPDTKKGFNDPDGVYPTTERISEPDWDGGENTSTIYPHNIFFRSHGGHEIEIDSTTGFKRYRMYHPSGTVVVVDNTGNVDITIVANETRNITINRSTTIGGDDTTTISGNQDNTVTGNLTESITGNDAKTVTGNSDESVTGNKIMSSAMLTINAVGACNIIAGGAMVIESPNIKLGIGTTQTLLTSSAASVYNIHTHNGGNVPDQQMTTEAQTSIITAS